MEDIAPALLETLRQRFLQHLQADAGAAELLEAILAGKAGYAEAGDYAEAVGRALAGAFSTITGADLPDGRMYWNIADRVVRPLLEEDHSMVSDAAVQVQKALNRAAGLGLQPQTAPVDSEKINGILNRLDAADAFEDVAWILGEPVVTYSRGVVDATLQANVDFQGKTGLRPKVVRRAPYKCCEWCSRMAGSYTYPDVPRDVYRRHQNCRCVVEYDPGSGRRQNVHTKQWTEPAEDATILERRLLGLRVQGITVQKISDHVRQRMTERSVPVEDIQDAIENPLQVNPAKYDPVGRPSVTVVGRYATMAINPETGVIVTCYPTHTKTRQKLEALKK